MSQQTFLPSMDVQHGEMPCISMWRPRADWVARGWKPIETRTHRRFSGLVGSRIAIQAADHWDLGAMTAAQCWLTPKQCAETGFRLKQLRIGGCIICTASVVDHRRLSPKDEPKALIECSTERWGIFLEDVTPVDAPIREKGRQGIWYVNHRGLWVTACSPVPGGAK